MNEKIMMSITLILTIIVFSTSISSVFAVTEIYEHQYAGGVANSIQVPDGPKINFVMYRMTGDFGRVSDRIHIAVATQSDPENFVVVKGWEDNPDRKAFSDLLGFGESVLVTPLQMQVITFRKTTIAFWTIPLEVPATDDTQAFTVPPGLLILTGSGEKIAYPYEIPGILLANFNANYAANGKLYCRGWRGIDITGEVNTDTDWYWTLP